MRTQGRDYDTVMRCVDVLRKDGVILKKNAPVVIEPDGTKVEIKIRGCDMILPMPSDSMTDGKNLR